VGSEMCIRDRLKLMCKWNWLVSKLIVDVKDCPVAKCVCKK